MLEKKEGTGRTRTADRDFADLCSPNLTSLKKQIVASKINYLPLPCSSLEFTRFHGFWRGNGPPGGPPTFYLRVNLCLAVFLLYGF